MDTRIHICDMIVALIYSKEFLPNTDFHQRVHDHRDRNTPAFERCCTDIAVKIVSEITPTTADTLRNDLRKLSLEQLFGVVIALQFHRPTARKSTNTILKYIKMALRSTNEQSADRPIPGEEYARVVVERDALREANESLLVVNKELIAEVNELTEKLSEAETAREAITRDCFNITRAFQTSQDQLKTVNGDLKSVGTALQEMTELQRETETKLYDACDSYDKLYAKFKKQRRRNGEYDGHLQQQESISHQQEIISYKQEILLCQKAETLLRQANALLMDENTSLRMQLREEQGKSKELSEELVEAAATNASISKCLSAMTAEMQRLRDNSTAAIANACTPQ